MKEQAGGRITDGAADPAGAVEHGGRLASARLLFPGAPEPFVDLSTGINPVAYPVPALPSAVWTRLPEPGALTALQLEAALAYRVRDPAMVVAAPGTQILISLLPHLLGYGRAAILGPTYGEHLASWRNAGRIATEVAEFGQLGDADVAVVCNPNNPDGRRYSPGSLLALAEELGRHGGLLILDEAFVDFEQELSLAPFLPHPNVLILRSFGKTYGLAGVRLGFALATPPLAARLRAALGAWAVGGAAIELGRSALADGVWREAARRRVNDEAERLDAMLDAAGLRIVGGTALFRLVEHERAPALFNHLGRAGILVRRFAAQPGWLRFGLPAPDQWLRVSAVLNGRAAWRDQAARP